MYKIIFCVIVSFLLFGCRDASKDLSVTDFMLQYNKVKKECDRLEFVSFVTYNCKDRKDNMTFEIVKREWVGRGYTRSGADVTWGVKEVFIEAPEETKW